jgi:flagellar basal-body rod protein FlgC
MSGINAIFSTGLSGLTSGSILLANSANNIANLNSRGFKSARVNLQETPDKQGVQVGSITKDQSPGGVDENGDEQSNTDLPGEIVQLRIGSMLYNSNAQVVNVGLAMLGTLLDVVHRNSKPIR